MSVTPELKAMLADRAKRDSDEAAAKKAQSKLDQKWDRIRDETFAMIDKAAPFMDEGCPPDRWAPSTKLKLLYCVSSTNGLPGGEKRAVLTILRLLERGRKLWIEGLHPDPWAPEPKVRL